MTGVKILAFTPVIAAFDLPPGMEKYGLVFVLTVAVLALYRDQTKRNNKVDKIAADRVKADLEQAKADTMIAEAISSTNALLVEFKDAILTCQHKGE